MLLLSYLRMLIGAELLELMRDVNTLENPCTFFFVLKKKKANPLVTQ